MASDDIKDGGAPVITVSIACPFPFCDGDIVPDGDGWSCKCGFGVSGGNVTAEELEEVLGAVVKVQR